MEEPFDFSDLISSPSKPEPKPEAASGGGDSSKPELGSDADAKEHYMAKGDMRETMLFSFMEMLQEFLCRTSALFASAELKKASEEFSMAVADKGPEFEETRRKFGHSVITQWYEVFRDYYESVESEEADDLFEGELPKHPLFIRFRVAQKWARINPGIRKATFMYLKKLCEFANVYTVFQTCPDGLFGTVTKIADELIGKMQSGSMSAADVRKMDLREIGKSVLSKTDKKEQENFAAVLKDSKKMSQILTIIESLLAKSIGPGVITKEIQKAMAAGGR